MPVLWGFTRPVPIHWVGEVRRFRDGECLAAAGRPSPGLLVLAQGRVALSRRDGLGHDDDQASVLGSGFEQKRCAWPLPSAASRVLRNPHHICASSCASLS